MVFSSITFLFLFLPIVLFIYYLLGNKYRNLFLTTSSLFFYAWGEMELVMLMVFSIAINYIGGLMVDGVNRWYGMKYSKITLLAFVSLNILLLFYYKYFNFFVSSVNDLDLFRMSSLEDILLPIGISFFTFQGMSYLIDVYYKKVVPQKSLVSLALYICMFPQLIAGPIVRYIDVAKQIEAPRNFRADLFSEGISRFVIGLFKKVIIANQMGFIANEVFSSSIELGSTSLWIGIITYTFQIYFDFSGYSDMAIGLGKMFGFNFLENFNYPYISSSIQEFWRRWHISLSSWFRDYLYIPMGGNRKSRTRTYINLIIVFFVTGLWHGASWNFIIWGLFHGGFLILERLGFGIILRKLPRVFGHLYVLFIVIIGWVFFRAKTLTEALLYLKGMFSNRGFGNESIYQHFNYYVAFVLILALLFSTPIKTFVLAKMAAMFSKPYQQIIVFPLVLFLFFFSLLELAESSYNPFIYFRF